jgi:hypothetical protein
VYFNYFFHIQFSPHCFDFFFFYLYLLICFFNLMPHHLVLFDFYINFSSHSFNCYLCSFKKNSISNLVFLFFAIWYFIFFTNIFSNLIPRHLVSFYFGIKFDLHSFNCYLFSFYLFPNWIIFLISSISVWFWFILMLDFVYILLIAICVILDLFSLPFFSRFHPLLLFLLLLFKIFFV